VSTAIPYYQRFLARFPDVGSLAAADAGEVMRLWSGLGYYARARNLHEAARRVAREHAGRFPLAIDAVAALPGVGRSTAAAIVAFATGEPHAILDGNVKRVLARHAGVDGAVSRAPVIARLWAEAEARLPREGVEGYTQGLMDLGALVCTRSAPACDRCPVRADCVAHREGRTGELPERKAARVAKRREAAWLVAVSGSAVLVELRPAAGIWGGLWSVPELPAGTDARDACAALGIRADEARKLPPVTHAFTHFTLRATPWLVRGRRPARLPADRERRWLRLADAKGAALPAPVKRLIGTLAKPPSRSGAARAGSGAGSRAVPRRR
jgi:A/G-specific adenine glycosylase